MKIREQSVPIERLTFGRMILMMIRNLRGIALFLCAGSVILFVICGKAILPLLFEIHLIFWCGLILSFALHEYMHCICFRRAGIREVTVDANSMRFSLLISEQMSERAKAAAALAGPLVCGGIGIVLLLLNTFVLRNVSLKFISYIFCFHLINFFPIFGDGKILLQYLISKHS